MHDSSTRLLENDETSDDRTEANRIQHDHRVEGRNLEVRVPPIERNAVLPHSVSYRNPLPLLYWIAILIKEVSIRRDASDTQRNCKRVLFSHATYDSIEFVLELKDLCIRGAHYLPKSFC